jgi:hypothetical protein
MIGNPVLAVFLQQCRQIAIEGSLRSFVHERVGGRGLFLLACGHDWRLHVRGLSSVILPGSGREVKTPRYFSCRLGRLGPQMCLGTRTRSLTPSRTTIAGRRTGRESNRDMILIAAAGADQTWVFIELGAVVFGLALLARQESGVKGQA